MMENLFMDMLDKGVVVFLDDILIYSNNIERHFKLLKKLFTYLSKHTFYCKFCCKKCSFLWNTTTFLGFDITSEGMCIIDAKVRSLKE